MRIFQQNIFSVKRSISPTTSIFFQLSQHQNGIFGHEGHHSRMVRKLSAEIITGYEEDKG